MQDQQRPLLACNTADMPTPFADNVAALCARCGVAIYHRAHALRDLPGAIPVCLPCALRDAAAQEDAGAEVTFMATRRTLREVVAELGRAGQRRGRKGRA